MRDREDFSEHTGGCCGVVQEQLGGIRSKLFTIGKVPARCMKL